MNEQLLHYLWKHKLFSRENIQTTENKPLKIIFVGEHNHDAGPDFFNGRVKIDGTEWAGSVEIHNKASDWFVHGHDKDPAYNNVILHVVAIYDVDVVTRNSIKIPTFVLPYEKRMASNYKVLAASKKWISCEDHFQQIDPMIRSMWTETLLIERLQRKSEAVSALMSQTNNDLDEVFYQVLCRNMGFKINAQPFEQLARAVPLKIVRKQGNDAQKIEALLFGAAGLLQNPASDYQKQLTGEFSHLANRFQIKPLNKSIWKFARMRPVNFPTVRIAQLADLLSRTSQFTQELKNAKELEQAFELFHCQASTFWETHYTFQKESRKRKKLLGNKSIENIIINSVFPFMFVVSKYYDDAAIQKKIFSWMENLPPEKNRIIDNWIQTGAEINSGYESQAYIELYNEYCKHAKCLNCRLGGYIIREM